jgi:dihydrofolate reductase
MIISLIAAIDQRGAIGQNNRIPWRQSADLRRFQSLTTGHYVVMGRRTYESLPAPRQLPGRKMIVLSTDDRFAKALPDHVTHHRSTFTAIEYAEQAGESELFLIGGWEVYMMGLMFADKLYLTRIATTTLGKVTKFPDVQWTEWAETRSAGPHPANDSNDHPYTFEVYERLDPQQIAARRALKRQQQQERVIRGGQVPCKCEQCGADFMRNAADHKQAQRQGRNTFCSLSCAAKFRQKTRQAETSIACICSKCGVAYNRAQSLVKNSKYRYCSVECYRADLSRVRQLRKMGA